MPSGSVCELCTFGKEAAESAAAHVGLVRFGKLPAHAMYIEDILDHQPGIAGIGDNAMGML